MKSVVSLLAVIARRLPWVVIALTLALSGVFGFFARDVEIASGNEGFAPEGPEISASETITEKFGDDTAESTLQVIVRDEGGDVITLEGLETVRRISSTIRSSEVGDNINDRADRPGVFHYLSGVEGVMAAQQIPLEAMTDDMVKQFFALSIDPSANPENPQAAQQAQFLLSMVGEDFDPATNTASSGMTLAFLGGFPGDPEEAFNAQVDEESAMAADLATIETDLEVRPFSFPLLLTGSDDFTQEVGQLFGMATAVILVILLSVFWLAPGSEGSRFASTRRTIADTLITLATIGMAITWMQGIGVLLEDAGVISAFSAPTQIVPILLIGLGVDYAIHLTSRYREEVGEGGEVDEAMTGAIKSVGIALALATVTTVIGFLTNVFNPVPALKDFGILAAVGIVVSFALMLTFVPAIRMLADRRAERDGTLPVASLRSHGDRALPRIMEKLSVLAEKAPIPTLLLALALGGAGYYGFTQLETEFSFTDFLPEDSPYIQTLDLLEAEFGGGFGEQTQVLVEATADRGIDAAVHNALVAANSEITEIEDVSTIDTGFGKFANAASPIGLLGQMLQGGPEATPPALLAAAGQVGLQPDLTISADADPAVLYRALLEIAPEQAARVVSVESGAVDALLWDITTTAGEDVDDLRVGLDSAFKPINDLGAYAIDTSQNIIGDVVISELTASQSQSLFITIAAAALVLIINFIIESRRWFLGVITIAPVALVVLWTYGLMFASGIPFGPVTATLAALAIGIGVPFTIHIARRFQEDRKVHSGLNEAMRSTMRHTGGALAGSAFTTMAGFGVLISASLIPFRQMGQVTVYAIGLSLAASVLVLPSMLALWDRYHRRNGDALIGSMISGSS
ncbi:MAG: MMPL family transporter [Acidimicrobiia bacterium]|nr:MMPL family transporter [Acidimicrobiia bacterium]